MKKLLPLLLLAACVTSKEQPSNCALKSVAVKLRKGTVQLPAVGKMVMESHYATSSESFSGKAFPSTQTEGISAHLSRSCDMLKKQIPEYELTDCTSVYNSKYSREWTPPESGKAGQAARGDLKPSAEQELWQGNMYWASGAMPAPGTRFLVGYKDKNVVVSFGHETGPASPSYLGGVTREVHFYLKANNDTPLRVGLLEDQSLPYGPIVCK